MPQSPARLGCLEAITPAASSDHLHQERFPIVGAQPFKKAVRIASEYVRKRRACRHAAPASGTVRHESVVARTGEHRLPHRLRCQLLQCAVPSGSGTDRSSLYTHHGRDLPQGTTRGITSPLSRERTGDHPERASTEEPSNPSGVGAVAHGALGGTDRTAHRSTDRAHSVGETASGDGAGLGEQCLSLPKREIDPEALARPATIHATPVLAATAATRQHSWRRVSTLEVLRYEVTLT